MPTFTLVSVPTTTKTTTATTPNPPAPVTVAPEGYCTMCKRQPCPFKFRTIWSHSSSNWSEGEWDGDRQNESEKRKKEQKEKEEKAKQKHEHEKTVLDPNHYQPSPIYIPSYEEDAPTLVNNLVPEPTSKEEKNSVTSRKTKTKDKPAGEGKEDTSEEQKWEKKEEKTKAKEDITLRNQTLTLFIKYL